MKSKLPLGKIDPKILGRLLSQYTSAGDRVLIGAGIGEDAAIIDMGHVYLVAKTDPITHVTGEIGRYAVHINANDIASMGGSPLWFLATILMPSRKQCPRHKKDLLADLRDLQGAGHRLLRRAHGSNKQCQQSRSWSGTCLGR